MSNFARYQQKAIKPVSTATIEAQGQRAEVDAFASIATNINKALYSDYKQQVTDEKTLIAKQKLEFNGLITKAKNNIISKSKELQALFPSDPEKYKGLMSDYLTTLKSDNAYVSEQVSSFGMAEYGKGFLSLSKQKRGELIKGEKVAMDANIKSLSNRYVLLAQKQGANADFTAIKDEFISLQKASMFYSEASSNFNLLKFEKDALSTVYKMQTDKILASDGTLMELQAQFDNTVDSGVLTYDEAQALFKEAKTKLNDKTRLSNAEAKIKANTIKKAQINVYNSLLVDTKNISTTKLNELLTSNSITPTQFKDIEKRMSDPVEENKDNKALFNQILANPEIYPMEQVLNSTSLTQDQITKLVPKIQSVAKYAQGENYKQAVGAIGSTFGITSGGLIPQMSTKDRKAYGQMIANLYSEIGSLPTERRESEVLSIANRLMAEYDDKRVKTIQFKQIEDDKARSKILSDRIKANDARQTSNAIGYEQLFKGTGVLR